MNSIDQNPMVIDSSGEDVLKQPVVFITRMEWHHPSTSGDEVEVTDVYGKTIWKKYAIAGGSGMDYNIELNAWYNGIKVKTLGSGTLYIHTRTF